MVANRVHLWISLPYLITYIHPLYTPTCRYTHCTLQSSGPAHIATPYHATVRHTLFLQGMDMWPYGGDGLVH